MAEFEWGLLPERPALRRAIRHQLRSLDRSLRILAEDFLASESRIDLLAVGGEGELVSIRIGQPGEDAAMLTRSLSDLVWLRPRTRDLRKLVPGLGIEPSAEARSILLCPDFQGETRLAIDNFPLSIELMVYRCYRHRGQLNVVLEPQKLQKREARPPHRVPDRKERPQRRSPSSLETLPDPSSGQSSAVATPLGRSDEPDPLRHLAPNSDFRTGLSDADLRLDAEETHGFE